MIVPSHRGRRWVIECLDSLEAAALVAQHAPEPVQVEVVLVINGERDDSPALVRAWAETPRSVDLIVLESDRGSVTHARTLGLEAATGEWVTFVDDDDRVGPGFVAALASVAGPGWIGVVPGARIHHERWDEPDWSGDMAAGPLRMAGRTGGLDEIGDLLRPVWGKVVSLAQAREIGFDDTLARYGDDTIFWLRLAERFAPTLSVADAGPEAAYLYRVRADGITGFGAATTWESHVGPVLTMLTALGRIGAPGTPLRALADRLAAAPMTRVLDHAREHPEDAGRVREALVTHGLLDQDSGPGPSRRWSGVTSTSSRRFLALFRAGKNSLHPKLVARLEEQNFDYGLSWYADEDPVALGMADGAAFVHHVAGQKWPGLVATFDAMADVIARYDYVWMPDDDLLCEPETVSEFFNIVADLGLDLAQPALAPGSSFVHQIVGQHPAFQVRFTNFVELMCPLMSRDMLARALPTMRDTLSGWGVDAVWPRMTRTGRIAIIDATPILHTRPILGGDGYQTNQAAAIPMRLEETMAFERYDVRGYDRPHLNFGGLLTDGSTVCLGGPSTAATEALLSHLAASAAAMPVSWLSFSRYLGDHADAVRHGSHPYLPVALNEALGSTGLHFAEEAR
ncbi:DUF707 domain-containing protein [Nocardioides sp.]|uniref:DUF707 domain-containing protein n=1 Tax=Nocardioides sp. TaxID=35761 RepID=UPI00260DF375|nr:DUF707 domain-containing protein [Nocardioides sp.]